MAEYMSATEAAKKWGLGRRRTCTLLAEGRIPGAIRVGERWIIPADAKKPADARIKSGKYIKPKAEEPSR
ncbi:MAG: DNA-binding protein [Clostridiales bacterium]|jgi:hypothetical protein|nr:DNA-binding protein [Clostridiales bacterium]